MELLGQINELLRQGLNVEDASVKSEEVKSGPEENLVPQDTNMTEKPINIYQKQILRIHHQK